ncbi:MAG: methionine--tRNA ligase [Herpetosiphonaceae bacterium]|nr:methionine--tRNA ligase [Herpetosiphonaceae bacterium]
MNQKILVAVAWPYANGPRHIGHVAGFGVPSDIFARYHRLVGNDVLMVSGTDDHGTPIMMQADKEGVSYRELADRYNEVIARDLQGLGLSYNLFTRTETLNHTEVTQDLFTALLQNGGIIKDTMLGTFAANGKALPDRYVEGTCPICGFPDARGDQCDNCGNQLDPVDLINPRSKIDGLPPTFRPTEHFFLDLPKFREQLRGWIEAQMHWRPNVRNFSLNLVDDLRPRAVTRDLDWGVPIPLPGYDEKRIYVWFDAVIGYLSAAIEWAHNHGTPDRWQEWWLNPAAQHYYFMGKDNITFHSVIWPAMLLGYREQDGVTAGPHTLNLPYNVVSTEFLTMEGKQFSTSRGVVIYVRDVLERYGADPLRYCLTAGGPETQDADFTWAEFVRRNNDELVATWGNLANRVLTIAHRNFGAVPPQGTLQPSDQTLLDELQRAFATIGDLIATAHFKSALAEAMATAARVNHYVSEQEPWKLVKSDKERAATVLWTALQAVDSLKIIFCPFLPFSSQALHEQLGYTSVIAGPLEIHEQIESNGAHHLVLTCEPASWTGRWQPSELPAGQLLPAPNPLFRKLEPGVVQEEVARLLAKE